MEYFFTQKLPKTIPVKRKKDLVLECMLSDPRPSVTWTKNGEKLEVWRQYLGVSSWHMTRAMGILCDILCGNGHMIWAVGI